MILLGYGKPRNKGPWHQKVNTRPVKTPQFAPLTTPRKPTLFCSQFLRPARQSVSYKTVHTSTMPFLLLHHRPQRLIDHSLVARPPIFKKSEYIRIQIQSNSPPGRLPQNILKLHPLTKLRARSVQNLAIRPKAFLSRRGAFCSPVLRRPNAPDLPNPANPLLSFHLSPNLTYKQISTKVPAKMLHEEQKNPGPQRDPGREGGKVYLPT
jgi:hypothetical protein